MPDLQAAQWLWFAGWLAAVLVLFAGALRLPVAVGGGPARRATYAAACVGAAAAVAVLAVTALTLHDAHVDLTREKIYTPSPEALAVARGLTVPVRITYFYQAGDAQALRVREHLTAMASESPLLEVDAVDPDREPTLARMAGIKVYNTALVEAQGRRLLVPGTDETDIALGIRRVLRETVTTVCFLTGHNQYPADNYEFHTHLEGAVGHSHDSASAQVVEMPGHGVGRLRRSLEALGYEIDVAALAIGAAVPAHCAALVEAGPRTRYTPAETAALRDYLARGGSALLLYDLGFPLDDSLVGLLGELGIALSDAVLVDPEAHYGADQEMIAVTGYETHPITRHVAYTFYPGARPLVLGPAAEGVAVAPLVRSGRHGVAMPLAGTEVPATTDDGGATGHVIAAASEGRLGADATGAFRAVVAGDADFVSNSFYPYMANSDLALAMVRWLLHEERDAPLKARIPVPDLVLLTESQQEALMLVTALGMPLAVALLGVAVWWRRR